MNRRLILTIAVLTLLLATGAGLNGNANTATGARFAIPWYTVHGTIGQFDAGEMSSGAFGLIGGFWTAGFGAPRLSVYLPLVMR